MNNLRDLAELIAQRNEIDSKISAIIGRPAEKGHVGEYIASHIFDIEISKSATNKGSDGYFRNGTLAGKTVNIKFYAKHEGILDVNTTTSPPDYYLVLAGPTVPPSSSRGGIRPWIIESVFIFNHNELMGKLQERGIHIGVATSITKKSWIKAEVYPNNRNEILTINEEQKRDLALFGKRF